MNLQKHMVLRLLMLPLLLAALAMREQKLGHCSRMMVGLIDSVTAASNINVAVVGEFMHWLYITHPAAMPCIIRFMYISVMSLHNAFETKGGGASSSRTSGATPSWSDADWHAGSWSGWWAYGGESLNAGAWRKSQQEDSARYRERRNRGFNRKRGGRNVEYWNTIYNVP